MRSGTLRGGRSTLDSLIYALCDDYSRRETIIKDGSASRRTLLEMEYLNYKIYSAAAEISGDALAPVYIKEIGSNIGYAKSEDYSISEVTYKLRKSEIKKNIGRKLHLFD